MNRPGAGRTAGDSLAGEPEVQTQPLSMRNCTMKEGRSKHKERTIKVDAAFRPDRWHRAYRPYARLRLQGRWLERAGFVPGMRVAVAVADGRLTLSKVEG